MKDEGDEIVRILKVTDGRVGGPDGAAARMDIKRTILISRLKKLGIDPRRVALPLYLTGRTGSNASGLRDCSR